MNIVKSVDYFLDHITMYRLVLYILVIYVLASIVESLFGYLPFSPISIITSTLVLVLVCVASNKIISGFLKAPTNVESSYITALILALIITPSVSLKGLGIVIIIGLISTLSKYLLAYRKKHIFNPAAVAIVISGLLLASPASWWVGTASMAPFFILGGLILVRKLRFSKFVTVFLTIFLILVALFTISQNGNFGVTIVQIITNSSLVFMATIMLVEPQTMPGTRSLRYAYASLVALLSVPYFHFGNLYIYPEQALVIGNIFSFLTGVKGRYMLELKEKISISKNVWELVFAAPKLNFKPGQYLEWTLPHPFTDRRGARRYFTIASNPGQEEVRIGIKFDPNGSSFKNALNSLELGSKIAAANVWGNFVLPRNNRKIVLIAGGIGITPYVSMIRSLLSNKEKRDIVLIYSNTHEDEISYRDLLDIAEKDAGVRIIYTLTGNEVPPNWRGEKGRLSLQMVQKYVPEYKEALFYVSGSKPLIDGVKKTLKETGVSLNQIKTDYFPGYA